ncbi:methyltransferase type 12 [Candidatus Scalindua japonica]|uniref:Methyltransferase type 12 n=1 Tax=Candidatus Scalindua japonica TaxID=1284222 RepID=A0A286TWV5_9BACT|nr:methyltransferase domain-containing protein [Candidatus Scalindua japonica]GAX60354.1 methyltransferase type 12 [Candidatus Scalindua japonica]
MRVLDLAKRLLPISIKLKGQCLINNHLPRWLSRKKLHNIIEHKLRTFNNLKESIRFLNYDFKDKNVLELGPGYLFGLAYLFLAEGAKNTGVVDSFDWKRFVLRYDYVMEYYRKHIEQEYNTRIEATFYPTKSTSTIQSFVNENGDSGYAANEIDLIYSNACLEHVRKVDTVFKNMFRVLKTGGIMVHQIDLRNHYDFDKPLDYLRLSDQEWETQNHPDDSYTNRLRVCDYRNILNQYPHRVLKFAIQFDDQFTAPDDINQKFINSKDVDAVGLFMVIEKL